MLVRLGVSVVERSGLCHVPHQGGANVGPFPGFVVHWGGWGSAVWWPGLDSMFLQLCGLFVPYVVPFRVNLWSVWCYASRSVVPLTSVSVLG